MLLDKEMILVAISLIICMGSIGAVEPILSVLLKELYGMSIEVASLFFAAPTIFYIAGAVLLKF